MQSKISYLKKLTSYGKIKLVIIILVFFFVVSSNIFYRKSNERDALATLLTDRDFLPSLIKDIEGAKSSIYCAIYMFKSDGSDDSSGLIVKALQYASQNNVNINIILDIGNTEDLTTKFNTYTAKELLKYGIKVYFDSPYNRLHSKMCIIDDIVYIGSHNYTYSATMKNNEASVRIVSKDMAQEGIKYVKGLISSSL